MGAISIEVTGYGRDIREAFSNAQEEAEEQYGNDSYNGAINNCSLIGDYTSKRPTMHPDELAELILSKTNKREVIGYCLQQPKLNENKIKTQVQNFPQEGARKWVTIYKAVDWYGKEVVRDKTQTGCIKKARAYVEKHTNTRLDIIICKELETGNSKCATISYKPAAGERLGKYLFIGMASY